MDNEQKDKIGKSRKPWPQVVAGSVAGAFISVFLTILIYANFGNIGESPLVVFVFWPVYLLVGMIGGFFLVRLKRPKIQIFIGAALISVFVSAIFHLGGIAVESRGLSREIRIVVDGPPGETAFIDCCILNNKYRFFIPVSLPYEETFLAELKNNERPWIQVEVSTYLNRPEYIEDPDGRPICEIWVDGRLIVREQGEADEVVCGTNMP